MNNNDKLALIDGSAKVQTQIEIKPLIVGETSLILREYDYISKWDMEDYKYVPNHGFIGQFVERILNVSLKNLPTDAKFENKELVLKLGVLTDDGVTWYSLGNFLIYEAKYDDVAGLWNLKGKDFCKKFNKKYEDTITYPCTALQLATNVCSQCGCSLATTNFKNKDFVINENQFVNGETCREVMKAIGMLAFTWVRIGWDNRVYLDFDKKTTVDPKNQITNDNYYNLKVTREVYGPVNRILIGLSNVTGENVYVEDAESIENNGLCELDLYDNPLTYTEELRRLAIENASGLLGLTYTPVELNTTGYPWLNGNELIEIVDMENGSLQTYAFDRRIEYFGHIKSSIKAQSISNVESTYKYNGSIKERIKRTEISVDKANGKISLVAETVDTIEKEITPTGQASGSNIHITDSADAELLDFKLYGKSTQETITENLFDNTWEQGAISSTTGNTGDDTSSIRTTNFIRIYPNYLYEFSRTISTSYMVFRFYDINKNYLGYQTTEEMMTSSVSGNRMIAEQNSMTFTITNTDVAYMKIADASNDLTTIYTLTTNCPSPDYPSEIKSVGYQNLFDKDSATYKNNYLKNDSGAESSTSISGYLTSYIPIEPNEKYTIQGKLKVTSDTNSLWRLYFYDKDKNWIKRTNAISQNPPYTFTTPENACFMQFQYIISVFDADTIQIEKGEIPHPYIPFGKYGVEVETIGKNKLNSNSQTQTVKGITITNNGDGTFTASGTSTGTLSIRLTKDKIKLDKGKTYTNSIEILSGSLDNATIAVTVKNTNDKTTYNYINLYPNVLSNTKTPTEDLTLDAYGFYVGSADKTIDVTFRVQFEENDKKTSWEEYKKTTTLIQLDEPLRSLPNGVKDELVIENGKTKLIKRIRHFSLKIADMNNNEDFPGWKNLSQLVEDYPKHNGYLSTKTDFICNITDNKQAVSINTNSIGILFLSVSRFGLNQTQWKEQYPDLIFNIQYGLATPEEIDLGEITTPQTYKGVTNISTNDDLQPNMEVTYIRDNALNGVYQTQNGMNKYYTKVENDAQLEIVSDEIKSSVTEINTTIDTIRGAIETINQTMLTQTADQFEMLFKQTGIKELVDSVDALTKSNNATLVEQEQWIRFKGGNIELGRSDSQVKLLLSNDKISFLTGGNESAYISNNQLYITDSTILNKLQVGHWETKEENGNLNTRWIEGGI